MSRESCLPHKHTSLYFSNLQFKVSIYMYQVHFYFHKTIKCNSFWQRHSQANILPVSVSKLTVAWNRFPCFKMSRVSAMSGLSLMSWILSKALSRFNQKLISCKAVPDAGSRSSLVTWRNRYEAMYSLSSTHLLQPSDRSTCWQNNCYMYFSNSLITHQIY